MKIKRRSFLGTIIGLVTLPSPFRKIITDPVDGKFPFVAEKAEFDSTPAPKEKPIYPHKFSLIVDDFWAPGWVDIREFDNKIEFVADDICMTETVQVFGCQLLNSDFQPFPKQTFFSSPLNMTSGDALKITYTLVFE